MYLNASQRAILSSEFDSQFRHEIFARRSFLLFCAPFSCMFRTWKGSSASQLHTDMRCVVERGGGAELRRFPRRGSGGSRGKENRTSRDLFRLYGPFLMHVSVNNVQYDSGYPLICSLSFSELDDRVKMRIIKFSRNKKIEVKVPHSHLLPLR